MKQNLEKSAGIALVLSAFLITITMVGHPLSGGFEHLLQISDVIIVTHVIAITSFPLAVFGLWVFTKELRHDKVLPTLAFVLSCFSFLSVLLAATLNGIVLPLFVSEFAGASQETINSIQQILKYNTILNKSFDFIYIGSATPAIVLWSFSILRTKVFPKWIGFFGMIVGLITLILTFSGLEVDLTGFRAFAFAFVVWTIIIGIALYNYQKREPSTSQTKQ